MSGPTVGSLFAGYGGVDLALHDMVAAHATSTRDELELLQMLGLGS